MGATAVLSAVSAAGSIVSAKQQSSAIRTAGQYERMVYEQNSRFAALQAQDELIRGEKEAQKRLKLSRQIIGSQRAALAAQGIDVNSDDALLVQEETRQFGAEDALTIRNNFWRSAWGYKVQANEYAGRGAFAELTAKNQARNTILTGGLQAARDIAGGYYESKRIKRYLEI